LSFFLTLLVAFFWLVLVGKLISRKSRHGYSNTILRWWSMFWAFLVGINIRGRGWKPEFTSMTSVIVTNHNSYLDTLSSYITIRSRFKTLAKKELQKAPLMGPIFLTSGIMVDRSSPEGRKASYQRMVDAVNAGTSVMIFPEGTQNRTDDPVREFYDGAFKLAVETGVPIIPSVVINSRQLMPQANFKRLRPGKIRQYFLDPIPTTGLTEDDIPALKEKIRDLMHAKVLAENPTYPR
jgi:1-acyl-sn-glycerol-3-phosphate acyltransferase